MSLKNQVAVITGASSGLGAAVARELDQAGMKLVLTARRGERLDALAAELGEAHAVAADITDPEVPARLIDAAISNYGQVDVVLNNAGILEMGPIEKIDVDRVCAMVRVNVEAAFRMAYVAMHCFTAQKHGHLVNTSSILGSKVRPTAGAYAGTKWAIEALTEALRMEAAGSGVRVSCIEPGLVRTELHDSWETPPAEALGIARPLVPEDVAPCVRFILEQPEHVSIPRLLVSPSDQQL